MCPIPTAAPPSVPVAPTAQEIDLARAGVQCLVRLADEGQGFLTIRQAAGKDIEVRLPEAALNLLLGILRQLAEGNAVSFMPVHMMLTTQEAADLLGVSRPYLVRLLEGGQIPFEKVGTHRRIRLQDLLAYTHASDARRRQALEELTQESQRLDLPR